MQGKQQNKAMRRRRMPRLLAIDPGPTHSAYVYMRGTNPVVFDKVPNDELLADLRGLHADTLAIEMIASYGMPVGAEVFNTCTWIGHFERAWIDAGGATPRRITRKETCLHVCNSPRATDATIRQALIDRFGPGKERAIGLKAAPGPLFGSNVDTRAAIAVALTALETPDPARALTVAS